MMRVRYSVVALVVFGALSLLPALSSAAAHKDVIETIGIGRVDPKLTNETQRRATGRDAAVEEAQVKMLSILNDLRLDGKTPNQEIVQSGILQGAKIVKTEWIADDQCRVTLRLDKKRYETLTGDRLHD